MRVQSMRHAVKAPLRQQADDMLPAEKGLKGTCDP